MSPLRAVYLGAACGLAVVVLCGATFLDHIGGAPPPPPSVVSAQFQDGQTFVTWPDPHTGTDGANYRFRVVRSNAPITSGNYGSATVIGRYWPNNSGQMFGGDPANSGESFLTQTYRTNGAKPMARLSDLGTPLAAFTGLFVHTATGAEDAYYAVIETNTADGADSYVGSVGPVSEAVQTAKGIKQYDSSRNTVGRITSPAGLPITFQMHDSSNPLSCGVQACTYGDLVSFWSDLAGGGAQESRQTRIQVAQFSVAQGGLYISDLDGTPSTAYGAGQALSTNHQREWWHSGGGFTPNPLVGPANRFYPFVSNLNSQMLGWAVSNYGTDINKMHCAGKSMGAVGCGVAGMRQTSPAKFASVNLIYPLFQRWRQSCANWTGITWESTDPFKASGSAPCTLGTDASTILMPDGSPWGAGGYTDIPAYLQESPGEDMPFVMMALGKADKTIIPTPANGTITDNKLAIDALQASRRGHAAAWSMGDHDNEATDGAVACLLLGFGTGNADSCYSQSWFALNLPYIATSNSSINDNIGTGTQDAFGFFDGDPVGGVELGFKWTITSDTPTAFNFTISNTWMTKGPLLNPAATLAASMASTGIATMTVDDGSVFLTIGSNPYFSIGDTEIIRVLSRSGNILTFASVGCVGSACDSNRGKLYTTKRPHSAGELVKQYRWLPNGPVNGPFPTMTFDATPRRIQNFIHPDGTTISCAVTANGDAPVVLTGTVFGDNGVFTLEGVPINDSGVTTGACIAT